MAQKRFIKYLDPINSFEANEKYSGSMGQGLHRGFDTITDRSALTFKIAHTTTGEVFTNKNGTSATSPQGIWITKQGLVVKEDDAISLSITANANAYERWDILVGEHLYDELNPGGIPAQYSIIPGGNRTEPSVVNTYSQVVLGRIRVPSGATDTSNIIWERRRPQGLGGNPAALLNWINRFENQNQEMQATSLVNITTDVALSRNLIANLEGGNVIHVDVSAKDSLDLLPDKPHGTEITLYFYGTAKTKIGGYLSQLVGNTTSVGYAEGYRPILADPINPGYYYPVEPGDAITLRKVNSGNTSTGAGDPVRRDYWLIVGAASGVGTTRRIAEKAGLVGINKALMQLRYTQTGGPTGNWSTNGLYGTTIGGVWEEVIHTVPILNTHSSAQPLIEGEILGNIPIALLVGDAYSYTLYLDIIQGATTSSMRLIYPVEVEPGGTVVNQENKSIIGFNFSIQRYGNNLALLFKTHSNPGSAEFLPTLLSVWGTLLEGGGSISTTPPAVPGQGVGLQYIFPLPSLNFDTPLQFRLRASGIPTLTNDEYEDNVDDNRINPTTNGISRFKIKAYIL